MSPPGPSFPGDVTVVVISYNKRDLLPRVLAALEAAQCPREAILVVDVASSDGTADWLRACYAGIRIERLEENVGGCIGRNVGLRRATSRYVFLMDGDVEIEPATIQRLRSAMAEDSRIKISSPIVVHASAPEIIQYAGGSLHFICEAINPWMGRPLTERGKVPRDVGVAPACGLLLDREAAIEVGLFDERHTWGKDDGDFTHRIRMAGYRILEVPDAVVRHHSRPRGTEIFYYQIRSRWHFMLKNYEWRTLVGMLPCLMVHEPLQLLVLHAHGHGRTYWKSVGGLLSLLPALPRDRALIRAFRSVPDSRLLGSAPFVIREDLSRDRLLRSGRRVYEGFLQRYWWLLTHTVLAR
jgi:GT2 family glycosyltransferase